MRRTLGFAVIAVAGLVQVGCPEPKTAEQVALPLDDVGEDMPDDTAPPPPPPPPEAGSVRLGSAMMTGGNGLSREGSKAASKAFVEAFEAGKSHFRQCYAKGLERDATRQGSVDVRVILDRSGQIYEMTLVASDLEDPVLTDCIVEAFRKLQYAPLLDGELFSVTAPVKLAPE